MIDTFIERIELTDTYTLGHLTIPDIGFSCWTLERPDLNNAPNISCIPDGEYEAKLYPSKKFGLVYRLLRVPERFGILLHAGNIATHSHGCILLGRKRGYMHGKRAVFVSKPTVRSFMQCTDSVDLKFYIGR